MRGVTLRQSERGAEADCSFTQSLLLRSQHHLDTRPLRSLRDVALCVRPVLGGAGGYGGAANGRVYFIKYAFVFSFKWSLGSRDMIFL